MMIEDVPDANQGKFSSAYYEYCLEEYRKKISLHGIHIIRHAIVGSKKGSNKAYLKRFSPNWLRIFTSGVES